VTLLGLVALICTCGRYDQRITSRYLDHSPLLGWYNVSPFCTALIAATTPLDRSWPQLLQSIEGFREVVHVTRKSFASIAAFGLILSPVSRLDLLGVPDRSRVFEERAEKELGLEINVRLRHSVLRAIKRGRYGRRN
jgi:hypothetical protein